MFARDDFVAQIVHTGDSEVFERSWHLLHTDLGPIQIGLWYRPPAYGEVTSIETLSSEMAWHGKCPDGCILVGDMNVHNVDWLTYSSSRSPEGVALHKMASSHGFEECVRKPTRGANLLDLVLADIPDVIKTHVLPGVSDHCIVLCKIHLDIGRASGQQSPSFLYAKADWPGLIRELGATRWSSMFDGMSADVMAGAFANHVLSVAKRFIPFEWVQTRRPLHPWINDTCRRHMKLKSEAFGTGAFASAQAACSEAISAAYADYVRRTKQKLHGISTSSKKWWRVAKEIFSEAL